MALKSSRLPLDNETFQAEVFFLFRIMILTNFLDHVVLRLFVPIYDRGKNCLN